MLALHTRDIVYLSCSIKLTTIIEIGIIEQLKMHVFIVYWYNNKNLL